MNNKMLHQLAYVLLWVGGLNWGLIGLFRYNLVDALFGSWPSLVRLVYVLVGVAALYTLASHKSYCMICKDGSKKKR